MAKHGKKYEAALAKVDEDKQYTPLEACTLAKEIAPASLTRASRSHSASTLTPVRQTSRFAVPSRCPMARARKFALPSSPRAIRPRKLSRLVLTLSVPTIWLPTCRLATSISTLPSQLPT